MFMSKTSTKRKPIRVCHRMAEKTVSDWHGLRQASEALKDLHFVRIPEREYELPLSPTTRREMKQRARENVKNLRRPGLRSLDDPEYVMRVWVYDVLHAIKSLPHDTNEPRPTQLEKIERALERLLALLGAEGENA
jgi:hypothetical protein